MQIDDEYENIWVLRIQGKIIPNLKNEEHGLYKKFSHFIHKIEIKFLNSENEEEYKDIEVNYLYFKFLPSSGQNNQIHPT